jgi:hypothetical protein
VKGLGRISKCVCVLHASKNINGVEDYQTVPCRPSGAYILVGTNLKFGK